jgi:NADH:ubiquinone oxidoreductase subunit 2 (subunit N)
VRRASEAGQPHFVDRFPAGQWLWIVLLLAATLVDAVLTLCLLEAGCEEINPLMGHVLQRGVLTFLVCKYVLTVAGLPVLVIFGQFSLFGTRLRVKHLLPVFVILYVVLIAYQCRLLQTAPGHALPRSESGTSAGGFVGGPRGLAGMGDARAWFTPEATSPL